MASGRTRGLPHEEFWRGFIGLLVDGVRFTAGGFIGGGRGDSPAEGTPAELHGAHMTAALPCLPRASPCAPLLIAARPQPARRRHLAARV